MLFNSTAFFFFFPIVTCLYFAFPPMSRWGLLLSASCVFYMWYIPKYILILFATILVDYLAAILIEKSEGKSKKLYLAVSIIVTCLILFVFKYFDFFNSNIAEIARLIHWNYSIEALQLFLPVGLSFHTFQSLSYVIEVYRGHQKAERHFGIYSLYVMFYPQLVAGPIERPQNLLHQFHEEHAFDYDRVTDGLKKMAWGLFKKVVIADRLTAFILPVYDLPRSHQGPSFVIATFFFAFQIYCDFSGYSGIAIGSAEVMGFKLMRNFNRPYFARSVSEFWKRWHISLSTWFRDYVYVPLGGNRRGWWRWQFNLFITFLISGLWHGANWTFIIWGALNGFYLIFSIWTAPIRKAARQNLGLTINESLLKGFQISTTFCLISLAWIFFRARSVEDAWYIISHMGSGWGGGERWNIVSLLLSARVRWSMCLIFFLIVIENVQTRVDLWGYVKSRPAYFRWSVYYAMLGSLLLLGVYGRNAFIYFQF